RRDEGPRRPVRTASAPPARSWSTNRLAHPHREAGSTASAARRLLLAQESGLVLVILAAMIGLAIYGATEAKRQLLLDGDNNVVLDADGERQYVEVNKFLNKDNLVLLVKDASFVAVMAVGMTFVILLGGIDLSVGSLYAFAALIGALLLRAI